MPSRIVRFVKILIVIDGHICATAVIATNQGRGASPLVFLVTLFHDAFYCPPDEFRHRYAPLLRDLFERSRLTLSKLNLRPNHPSLLELHHDVNLTRDANTRRCDDSRSAEARRRKKGPTDSSSVWLRCSSSRASTGQLDWAEGVMLRPVALDVGLSKPGVWWRRRDLNLRPRAYEFLAVGLAVVLGRSLVVDFSGPQAKKRSGWIPATGARSARISPSSTDPKTG